MIIINLKKIILFDQYKFNFLIYFNILKIIKWVIQHQYLMINMAKYESNFPNNHMKQVNK